MTVYDFSLDMDTVNSNSVILRNINEKSMVFEFGPAHGRMTKYLKEKLNCTIDIVEIDYKAGFAASKYANTSYLGPEQGDLNNKDQYMEIVKSSGNIYDYIIFADVLEHLADPKFILKWAAISMLKQNGSIWISVPNIGHNSVLIDLWNNKFEYRETGLLDKTHIKFFTESSLDKFVQDCGLKVKTKHNLINVVSNTEFNNSYDDVPAYISYGLKNRPNGEVYQFVWELTH